MQCLSHEQMLLAAFGLEQDADVTRHLAACAACRRQVEAYRALPEQSAARYARGEAEERAARERLLAALPERSRHRATGPLAGGDCFWTRATRLGGRVMKNRFALGGTAAAVVAVLLIWGLTRPAALSAMERTAQAVRKAKSYQCDLVTELPVAGVEPAKGRLYWSQGRRRLEMYKGDKLIGVHVSVREGAGISIDHPRKMYLYTRAMKGKPSALETVEALGKLSGEADEDLGTRRIGDVDARGFRVAMEKVDPDAGEGMVSVWTDPASSLPVLLVFEMEQLGTMRMENFRWDVALADELFQPEPPAGYTDTTPEPPDPDKQVAKIAAALRIYAEAFDGAYPQVKMVYGDVTSARLRERLGIPADPREASKHEAFSRYLESLAGFATLNTIQRENADTGYFGKTVGPEDAGKVLFYWRLEDGNYQVIYGDLRTESVDADRLRSLVKQESRSRGVKEPRG